MQVNEKGVFLFSKSKPYLYWVILLCGLHLWIRWPVFFNSFFHNEDVGGITYSASLLLKGGLPLVDTVEMKAPGSFFILAGWWFFTGISIESAQALGVLWSFLALLGIMYATACIHPRHWIVGLSGILYLLFSPQLDSLDINYGSWMITPYIWACALMLKSLQISSSSLPDSNDLHTPDDSLYHRKIIYLIATGCLVSFAALCKRQGAVLTPLFFLLIFLEHRKTKSSSDSFIEHATQPSFMTLCAAFGGGLVLGFIPIAVWYALKGHLNPWIHHYFLSQSGWSYVQGSLSLQQRWIRIQDGGMGLFEFMRTLLLLAFGSWLHQGIVWIKSRTLFTQKSSLKSAIQPYSFVFQSGLFIFSLIGVGLGWRFFKGYYLQLLPGLIWISLHPNGLLFSLKKGVIWFKSKGSGSKLPLSFLSFKVGIYLSLFWVIASLFIGVGHDLHDLQRSRNRRKGPLYMPTVQIRQISQWIQSQEESADHTIPSLWVWGRWAWPAYTFTDLLSPTRYFKNLGVLTTQLTNTWNPKTRSRPTRFNPKSPWPECIKELQNNPPTYLILAINERMNRFHALKKLIRSSYQPLSYRDMKLKHKESLFKVYRLKKTPKNQSLAKPIPK